MLTPKGTPSAADLTQEQINAALRKGEESSKRLTRRRRCLDLPVLFTTGYASDVIVRGRSTQLASRVRRSSAFALVDRWTVTQPAERTADSPLQDARARIAAH
jgi:hypothetical protein